MPEITLEQMRSLSSRRAWIEMDVARDAGLMESGRSPHGERGLKYPNRNAKYRRYRRSPHGERGLKSRRDGKGRNLGGVALLTESVD